MKFVLFNLVIRYNRTQILIEFLIDFRDIWIGLYWNRILIDDDARYDFYLCLLPVLPLRVSFFIRGAK